MKKAIFTVNLGGYDHQPIPSRENPEWDNILFTDQDLPDIEKFRWDRIIKVDPTERPDIASRDYKWRSHIHLPEYDLVCYHDANMEVIGRLRSRAFRIKHDRRHSIREEADALNGLGHRCTVDSVENQFSAYRLDGFEDDQGLFYGGFFARFHTPEENEVCEMVFDHVKKYTSRDQLAFPYAMWKTGYVPPKVSNKSFMNRSIIMRLHKKVHQVIGLDGKEEINVHHICPARADKNFGKAINDIVRGLPDEDWICLRDIDTLPLDHISFIKQCEDIANAGGYGLVSCMTNRLGLKHQLVYGESQKESSVNMTNEIEVAKNMAYKYGSEVIPETTYREIAGVMMLFPKKAWLDVGGFKEGGIIFGSQILDNIILKSIMEKGYKIGIAKGIYLFHIYRWGMDRATNKGHLRP